jgi:hypothetical protein
MGYPMTTLLVTALSIFWVTRLARVWVEAPSWVWTLVHPSLAALALIPWEGDRPWLAPLAASGIVVFLQLMENLLIARADESVASVMRRR